MTTERDLTISRVRDVLERRAAPRLHMLVLVAVTGAVGLLASYTLLHLGVRMMALRYPLAVGIAYVAFLGLVRVWLRRFRLRGREGRSGMVFMIDDLPLEAMWRDAPLPEPEVPQFGGGGGFAGGGAARSWGGAPVSAAMPPGGGGVPPAGGGPALRSGGGGWDLDLDEGALWLIPAAIIALVAFGIVIYLVYIAPMLLAELLLDAGLAAGLYRRLAQVERRHWLSTAIRNTALPAVFVAGLLALSGAIMQAVYPDAASIGGVVSRVLHGGAGDRP